MRRSALAGGRRVLDPPEAAGAADDEVDDGGGGGVPPSDLTSWIVKGTAPRSSPIFANELTDGVSDLSEVDDQTAFSSSGSGPRDGESLVCKAFGDLGQGKLFERTGLDTAGSS